MKKNILHHIRKLFLREQEQLTVPEQKVPPVPEAKPVQPAQEEFLRPDYKAAEYLALAKQCAMGDMVAMLELARWHRRHIRPSSETLFAAYEAGDASVYGELYSRLTHNYYDGLSCKAYVTWIARAALYGNGEAQSVLDKCGLYSRTGLIKSKTLSVGSFGCEHYYSSELNRLGLLDIHSGLDEFNLYPLQADGIFVAYYLSDYIPADSDGFGREDEYSDLYYDEFFNYLSGDYKKAQAALPAMKAKREAYWQNPTHDAQHRKYRRLLTES